jgi:hypothetical protein
MIDHTKNTTPEARLADAGSPEAAPERIEGTGSIIATETPQFERMRAITLLHALKLEASCGIKVFRGGSTLRIAQRDYGIKARTIKKAANEFEQLLKAHGIVE